MPHYVVFGINKRRKSVLVKIGFKEFQILCWTTQFESETSCFIEANYFFKILEAKMFKILYNYETSSLKTPSLLQHGATN